MKPLSEINTICEECTRNLGFIPMEGGGYKMKPITELNISSWPWCGCWDEILDKDGCWVAKGANRDVETFENCTLLRAAPELYECLYEAVEDRCRRCKTEWYGKCVTADGNDCEVVRKW